MAEEKVYSNEVITDQEFPVSDPTSVSTTQSSSNDTFSNVETKDNDFPTKQIAVEVLSTSLNTKSRKILAQFEFTQSGALQIGKYENGVSGDLRISPNGIVARNLSGDVTFSLDGDTGDAVFAGTIQAGSFVAGAVYVGDSSVVIDGENRRIVIFDENGIPVAFMGKQAGGF